MRRLAFWLILAAVLLAVPLVVFAAANRIYLPLVLRQSTARPATSTATATRTLTTTATATATVTATTTRQPAVCNCSADLYNCPDFATQAQAQACFNYCMVQVGTDVHRLDGDGNGIACESLP